MQYAIRFYQGCRVLPKADEIIVLYGSRNPRIIDFVEKEEYAEKRIIIDAKDNAENNDCIEIYDAIHKIHPNMAVKVYFIEDALALKERNIPFFFSRGMSSFDHLKFMVDMGVSDIYVTNEYGFMLPKISKLCHDNNIKVRVYPNVAQSAYDDNHDNIRKFFVRPSDVHFYEEYVDIFEFYGSVDKQPVLFDIYNDEKWLGYLNEVILGLSPVEIDERTIVPYFAEARIKCEKRCIFGKCDICQTINTLAETLKEKDLGMVYQKPKHLEFTEDTKVEENYLEVLK